MDPLFNSHETGTAFTHCCDCNCELTDASFHIVNQSYSGSECIFEFAMCYSCREKLNAQLSEESRVAVFDFMHDNTDMEKREKSLGNNSETEAYIEHCVTCNKPRKEAAGYTLGAMFVDQTILKGQFPILICDTCELELSEKISDETRDVWDKFIEENFPCPPSDAKLPKQRKPVML